MLILLVVAARLYLIVLKNRKDDALLRHRIDTIDQF